MDGTYLAYPSPQPAHRQALYMTPTRATRQQPQPERQANHAPKHAAPAAPPATDRRLHMYPAHTSSGPAMHSLDVSRVSSSNGVSRIASDRHRSGTNVVSPQSARHVLSAAAAAITEATPTPNTSSVSYLDSSPAPATRLFETTLPSVEGPSLLHDDKTRLITHTVPQHKAAHSDRVGGYLSTSGSEAVNKALRQLERNQSATGAAGSANVSKIDEGNITELRAQLNEYRESAAEAAAEISALKAENHALVKDNSRLSSELLAALRDKEAASQKHTRRKEENKAVIEGLRSELETSKRHIDAMERSSRQQQIHGGHNSSGGILGIHPSVDAGPPMLAVTPPLGVSPPSLNPSISNSTHATPSSLHLPVGGPKRDSRALSIMSDSDVPFDVNIHNDLLQYKQSAARWELYATSLEELLRKVVSPWCVALKDAAVKSKATELSLREESAVLHGKLEASRIEHEGAVKSIAADYEQVLSRAQDEHQQALKKAAAAAAAKEKETSRPAQSAASTAVVTSIAGELDEVANLLDGLMTKSSTPAPADQPK